MQCRLQRSLLWLSTHQSDRRELAAGKADCNVFWVVGSLEKRSINANLSYHLPFSRDRPGNQMLVIHGGSNHTIPDHYRLVQYVRDVNLPVLPLLTCACHQNASLMELTVLPDRLGPDPRRLCGENRDSLHLSRCWNVLSPPLPINNKSLPSRWSCASRHRTACQADRWTCLDNKVNLLTFRHPLPMLVFSSDDFFYRSCWVCDCSCSLFLSDSFHCLHSFQFYFNKLYNDLLHGTLHEITKIV